MILPVVFLTNSCEGTSHARTPASGGLTVNYYKCIFQFIAASKIQILVSAECGEEMAFESTIELFFHLAEVNLFKDVLSAVNFPIESHGHSKNS